MIRRLVLGCTLLVTVSVFADPKFDQLVGAGNYKDALDYADQSMPPAGRTSADWVAIAKANEKLGLTEKALASYMVSWRLNPKDYSSVFGAARISNQLGSYDQAADLAQKALAINFTGEASWEFARACIALNKPAEAKQALEKVIQTDPSNVVANSALGEIYFNAKQYDKAVALLNVSYSNKADGDVAYKLGRCYLETNNATAAIDYLKKTVAAKPDFYQAGLDLANALYGAGIFQDAVDAYAKVDGKLTLTAKDLFKYATANEKLSKDKDAVKVFAKAIPLFGADKGADAVHARKVVGADALTSKSYAAAVEQFVFLTNADPKDSKAFFSLSEAYAGQNDQANALKALEKVIALDAQNVEAYARLADIYSKSGQQDKAKATYEKMMGLRPNDPSVYLILGNYNRNAQKYAEALPLYLKSNMLAKSADALDGMAVCAAALDKWSEAMDAAESAVAADATKFSSRLVLAEALIRAKNYTAAKQHVDMVVAAKPGVAKYLGWQALCYDAAGDKDGLAKIDKQIVSLDKQDAASRLRLAKYDLDKGDKDGATVLLKELVTLTPKDPFVFKSLYQISKDKADKAGAISYLATYLILSPSDAEAHKNQGDQFYEKKDLDGALTEYRTALKIDPTVKGFYGRYAEIVIAKGQTEEAIKALNGVIASGDANAGTYQTLGSIYEKGKTYPKAIAMFQKALTLEPSNTSLLCALGDCQAESGDLMNAVSSYEQAVMMNTKAVTEYKTLGDLYTKQAKADQAFKAYAKYLDGNPADEAVAKKLADICYGKKDWAGTVKYLALAKSTAGTEGQLLMLGTAQFNLQKWADASTAFSKWFDESGKKASPKDKASVLLMAGTSYETQNLPDKAIEVYDEYCKLPGMRNADAAFKRALLREKNDTKLAVTIYTQNQKEYPQDTRNYLQLGLIYSKDQATLPKSAAMLEKAVANVGKDKTVWLSIAQVYGKLNQPAKELDAYKKYIEADPQNVQANVRIGSILMTNNKTSEAMVYLETANTLSPNNPDVMIKLAEGYVKTNRPKDALALLQKAKAVRKDDVDLRSNLFLSYAKLGMDKEAMQEVKELVDMTHDNKYRLEYARYLFTSGKHKDASEQIEDIKATNPEDLDALMLSADIRRADKQLDSAVQVYKEIGFINPDYAPALCGRADCHLEQNKPLWANDFYQKALRADPKCYKAYLGLARLAKVRKDNAGYADNVKKAFAIAPDDPDVKAEYAKISK